jgi:hypothetical protein
MAISEEHKSQANLADKASNHKEKLKKAKKEIIFQHPKLLKKLAE